MARAAPREFFASDEEHGLPISLYRAYYNAERPHIGLGSLAALARLRPWRVTQVRGDLSNNVYGRRN